MVTLVLADRASRALGRLLVGDGRGSWVSPEAARALGLAPESVEARVELSALGEAILAHWKRFGEFTPEIKPLFGQVMPDHFHCILEVSREMARPLGNAIGGFKTGCEKIFRALGGREGEKLWAEGFQDSILFRAGQLNAQFGYLRDNPRRLAVKTLFPDLFRVVGELGVDLRLAPQAQDKAPCSVPSTPCSVPEAPAAGILAVGRFSAIGNRFLLKRSLAQVQVSRRDFGYRREPKVGGGLKIARDAQGVPVADFSSPAFEEKREKLLSLAKHGVVLISPCVSDGEREIARQALEAGLPLVTLHNKGFSRLQKPAGRYFDACADGRLLMLAPAAWPFVPGEKAMTRSDATALNRLCQWIAGEGAAEINYHGMKPTNVDALAKEAARVAEIS